jgi:DNA-binding MarR family transcriptional regulator
VDSENYLKYWRVVRYYIKKKYKLTTAELEVLLFLKSEGRFSRDDFQKFNEVISWDKKRFEKLRQDGWIEKFRNRVGKNKALYQLTYKSKRVIASVYSKLNGDEIPTSLFQTKSYMDKVYRNFIEQLRHPSAE